jgi:intracellular septation protein
MKKNVAFRSLLLGGILPVVLFAILEEYYGVLWGVIVAMVFGLGELSYEKIFLGKIESITLWSNALILALGAFSLFAGEGIWFKLQPTILEIVMVIFLLTLEFRGKSFFVMAMEKQGKKVTPELKLVFRGITFRFSAFLLLHAALSAWAALHWSTAAWAMLKGLGFTGSAVLYFLCEFLWLRYRAKAS